MTSPPPSSTTWWLVFRTLAVAVMVIVTGFGPQLNVMMPPLATALTTAADVQLAGVPVPMTWSGWLVFTAAPGPRDAGVAAGVAEVRDAVARGLSRPGSGRPRYPRWCSPGRWPGQGLRRSSAAPAETAIRNRQNYPWGAWRLMLALLFRFILGIRVPPVVAAEAGQQAGQQGGAGDARQAAGHDRESG